MGSGHPHRPDGIAHLIMVRSMGNGWLSPNGQMWSSPVGAQRLVDSERREASPIINPRAWVGGVHP